ncbi:hypothetical protein BZA05DRAFT_393505, partial [Tricharina praecox]|uniref:uncharacterized protein n=1 Tax=Tricharina praecox TaxID=43433 RepID=UPI0022203437
VPVCLYACVLVCLCACASRPARTQNQNTYDAIRSLHPHLVACCLLLAAASVGPGCDGNEGSPFIHGNARSRGRVHPMMISPQNHEWNYYGDTDPRTTTTDKWKNGKNPLTSIVRMIIRRGS